MFYNCPVRKLASHSPPFCENTTHTQALTGTDSHSRARAHIRGHTLRHTCTDVRPMQLPLARGSQVGLGLRGEDPDRGPACTPQLWHVPSSCAAGPAGCLPLAGKAPGPPVDSVWWGSCTPFSQEGHLKVQQFEGRFPCLSSGSPRGTGRPKTARFVILHNPGSGCREPRFRRKN